MDRAPVILYTLPATFPIVVVVVLPIVGGWKGRHRWDRYGGKKVFKLGNLEIFIDTLSGYVLRNFFFFFFFILQNWLKTFASRESKIYFKAKVVI